MNGEIALLAAFVKYTGVSGKSIRRSWSDCKLCEQNNTTVKHNCPKRNVELSNPKERLRICLGIFHWRFQHCSYRSKYEAFNAKKFGDLQTASN